MRNKKIIYAILFSLTLFAWILFAIITFQSNAKLRVVFLDVGQGDSILISKGNRQMLIDGGKDGKLLLEKLGQYIPFWDRTIEVVVQTHPDQDHIGGLVDVAKNYKVDTVLKTNVLSESQVFKVLQDEIKTGESKEVDAIKGTTVKFDDQAQAAVLFPFNSLPPEITKDTNENSVVIKLTYGPNSFLFTGDLPMTSETKLLEHKIDLSAHVLKVGHHGSKYSTSEEFLKAVQPSAAIISVGKNNSYGHPNQEVLQRLIEHKINILRTDEIGDIIYECQNFNAQCQIPR